MKRKGRNARNLSVSLPGDLLEGLRQAAFDDNRSVSSLVTSLVQGHLEREGYLRNPFTGRRVRQAHLDFD